MDTFTVSPINKYTLNIFFSKSFLLNQIAEFIIS